MHKRLAISTRIAAFAPGRILIGDDSRRWARWFSVALILLVATAAYALRSFQLDRSFEVFVDEITYLRLSQGVAENLNVRLYGESFYLHPPGFFFLEGAYVSIFQPTGDLIHQVYDARVVNVLLGSMSAALIFLLTSKSVGWPWGLIAATLFAIDPFVIRQNSRNLLETATLFWVLFGYWILASGLDEDRQELPGWRILLSGLSFGFAILTKDMAVFLTLLPLGFLFLLKWSLPRRAVLGIGAIATATYAVYPIAVAISGDCNEFAEQKLRGFTRFLGLLKETGLNRTLGPSFFETIVAKVSEFGMTYVLIGFGIISILVLVRKGGTYNRLIAIWAASACGLLVYAILLGTLEEQFFYFLIVPCVVTAAISAATLLATGRMTSLGKILSAAGLVFSLLFLVWSGQEWINRHFTPDNGYESVLRYLDKNLDAEDHVAATSTSAQFLLGEYATGPWGDWNSYSELEAFKPEYVLVSLDQLAWDFGEAADSLLGSIESSGTAVFEFHANTNHVILYRLNWQPSSQIPGR